MDEAPATGAATVPLSSDGAPRSVAAYQPANEPAAGTTIGRYVVLERIGAGGMGIVLAAFDPELDRRLALKLIRVAGTRARDRQDRRERLAREARAMARLSHPNVVTVYDVGTLGDEIWVAMELVEGDTLRAWIEAAPRHWRRIVDVMLGAARGLAAAHAAGIVHRDFKPDNVLVDGDGRARVADFGLARGAMGDTLDASLVSADSRLTASGSGPTEDGIVLGTPSYMAPEIYDGHPADARSDQFAFCVAMFELLYGRRPFVGERVDDMVASMRRGRPRAVGDRGVPRRIHRVLSRGLAADPAARWGSMDELVSALDRDPLRRWASVGVIAVAGLAAGGIGNSIAQISDRCAAGDERFAEVWNDGHQTTLREAFAATGLPFAETASSSAVAALDGYGARWISVHRAVCEATLVHGEQSDELLDLRMACLDRRRMHVDAIVDDLIDADVDDVVGVDAAIESLPAIEDCGSLQQLRASAVELDEAARARIAEVERAVAEADAHLRAERWEQGLARIGQAQAVLGGIEKPALAAELALVEGRLQQQRGAYAPATAAFQRGRALAEIGAADALRLELELELADHTAKNLGDRRGATDRLALADAIWRRLGRPEAREHEVVDLEVALAHAAGRLEEAREREIRRLALVRRHAPARSPNALARLAGLEAELGRFDAATTHANEAIAEGIASFGAGHPNIAHLRMQQAKVLGLQDRWREAEPILERARAEYMATYGPDHPRIADVEFVLAHALRSRADNDGALALYIDVLRIRTASLPAAHPDLANAHNSLGVHLMGLGRHADALPHYETALAIRIEAYGPRHPDVAKVLTNRAIVLQTLGEVERAETDLREAIAIREAALGPEHPDVAWSLEALGNLLVNHDRGDEGEPLLRRALAIRERVFGSDHNSVATTALNLGSLELRRGNWPAAHRWCERALAIREHQRGKDHPDLVYSLDCLGHAALGEGDAATARPLFERALDLLAQTPERDALWGEASFGLARAIAGDDPRRAVTLARAARTRYAGLGRSRASTLAEIDAWLQGRDR